MRHYYLCFLGVLIASFLVGCFAFSVMDATFMVLSLPGPNQKGKIELSGFSLEPGSSDEVPELILKAIPAKEGKVYFTGRVQWTGLAKIEQSVSTLNQSMSAITDFQILFLWWSETDERYEVLIQVPYTEIYSVELWTPGFGTNIRFCHENDEIPVGDQVINIDRKTVLNIMKSKYSLDAERTNKVFALLDSKIVQKEEMKDRPSPCDKVLETDTESNGFGEKDFAEL